MTVAKNNQRNPKLSDREVQVMLLLCSGIPAAQAADDLFLSIKTIHKHRASIGAKTGLHSNVELVHFAIHNGLMTPLPFTYPAGVDVGLR